MRRAIGKIVAPLKRRIETMVARGVVRLIDDTPMMQELQVSLLAGEARARAERVQNYGLTAHPHPGAEAVVVHVLGHRDHPLVIAVDDRRYRLKALAEGEVAVYDDLGQKIVLYRDRIEVEAPKVVIKSDDVHLGAEGGARIARIGDKVNVGSGSSAGLHPIVEGSDKVRCAGISTP